MAARDAAGHESASSSPRTVTMLAGMAAGTGLTGKYYAQPDLTSLAGTRTDANVDFSWGSGAPPGISGMPTDQFSVRWTGQIRPLYTQTYTFYMSSDDGHRLFVDGQTILNNWIPSTTGWRSATISLIAGHLYSIEANFLEVGGGGASVYLDWSSASQGRQRVPQSALYPEGAGDFFPPSAPSLLRAGASTDTAISLNWMAASDNIAVTTYRIYRHGVQVGSSAANSFTDTGLAPSTMYLYAVRALDAAGNLSLPCEQIQALTGKAPSPFPAAWLHQDVGSTGAPGGAAYDDETRMFTITAAGANISGTADAFHFVYRQVTGDVEISARVTDFLSPPSPYAKGGVMIRGDLTAGSVHAAMFLMPATDYGPGFYRRTATNGVTAQVNAAVNPAIKWVRLVRQGNTFTGYTSADGSTWTQVGADTFALPAQAYIGLVASSRSEGSLFSCNIDNVGIKGLGIADLNRDGQVNVADYTALAELWLTSGPEILADIDFNQMVDLQDLAQMAQSWSE